MKASPVTRSGWYSLTTENDDRVAGHLIPTTMFLVKKTKLVPPGAFEAWLWRRWQPRID
jgi:hypothetical protein